VLGPEFKFQNHPPPPKFNKIQNLFNEIKIEGKLLNLIKDIYKAILSPKDWGKSKNVRLYHF
jgi:hypothetical protein